MRRRIPLLLLFLLTPLCLPSAWAQLYAPRSRPAEVTYRQFPSDHFRMIYQRGLYAEAERLAERLEDRLPEIRAVVGLQRELYVPVVLNRFTDRANGFVTPRPFRQEIEAVPIRGNVLSPRLLDWHEMVAPHELVHAAHAESGRGFGVGWFARQLGPDLARSLNLSGPRGINEGLAVWVESRLRPGAGRLHHSFFEMEFRAAMEGDNPWSLAQMLEPPRYTRPFDRFYIGGAHLFEFLERDGDVPFFRRARNFYYRMPLLGYGPALWYGAGVSPWRLEHRLQEHYRQERQGITAPEQSLSDVRTVTSARGLVHRRPTWLDDETLLAYAYGYHERPGFYRVDVRTGERRLLSSQAVTEDYYYTLDQDRTGVLFSRYVLDAFRPERATADVFRLGLGGSAALKVGEVSTDTDAESNDLTGGGASRVTDGERLFAPVRLEDGSVWALRNVDRFNEWVRIDENGEASFVGALEDAYLVALEPDPLTSDAAVLAHRQGTQVVLRAVFVDGELARVEPWLEFDDASIYDVSWSADGRFLLFTADPDNVANVFAWDRDRDAVYQITNVPYGAFEPSLSPDGRSVAFVNYRDERYDLAAVPFDLEAAIEWPRSDVVRDGARGDAPLALAPHSDADVAVDAGTFYEPILNLRPRVAYPFVVYQRPTGDERDVHLSLGGGAGVEWADPLQYWTAHTNLYYQNETLWGRAMVQTARSVVRPAAEVYREPSTLLVRRTFGARVDTVRVGRDELGLGVALRLPAVIESNVHRTTASGSLAAQYRTERLFGRDGETIRPAEGRYTLRPSASLQYRIQANPRDILPNTGLALSATSTFDVWSERGDPSWWLRANANVFLPFFRRSSTSVKVFAHLLAQRRGGRIDVATFLPRGYETENVFLGRGTFGKAGVEVVRPLWYIDDGFILPPVFFKVLYAYGFAEAMEGLGGRVERRAVVGGGLGLETRFFHGIDVALRWAPVYRFGPSDWSFTFR